MGVCTIKSETGTTVLGDFAACTQYSNEYIACENYKNGDDLVCKFNYYIFGDDARYVGALSAKLKEKSGGATRPDTRLWLTGSDAVTITNSMQEWSGDDKTAIGVPPGTSSCAHAEGATSICAWECARMCNSMDPAKPCRSFAWHQGKKKCELYGYSGSSNTVDKTYVELDSGVAADYDATYTTDTTELKGWAYFELGHWYVPKATRNYGHCAISAADDWAADGNAEETDTTTTAWNYRIQPTCAMIKDFPNVGTCDAHPKCAMQGGKYAADLGSLGNEDGYTGAFTAFPGRYVTSV